MVNVPLKLEELPGFGTLCHSGTGDRSTRMLCVQSDTPANLAAALSALRDRAIDIKGPSEAQNYVDIGICDEHSEPWRTIRSMLPGYDNRLTDELLDKALVLAQSGRQRDRFSSRQWLGEASWIDDLTSEEVMAMLAGLGPVFIRGGQVHIHIHLCCQQGSSGYHAEHENSGR